MNENKAPVMIPVEKLRPFSGHPFKVIDNEERNKLIESIQEQGILSPLIVRPIENTTDEYEVVSGHRRLRAAEKAGMKEVPAAILPLDKDTAAIAVKDSNLHREHIFPSEKAFAYKMKLDAMNHQGITSGQLGQKWSRDAMAETVNDSSRQIQRYIRLTYLIPELLDYMDNGKMALSVGVELSYLTEREQWDLLEQIEINDCTPSLSQACRMKKLSQDVKLSGTAISEIMHEEKANQKQQVRIPMERIRSFFPKTYAPADIENTIIKLCENYYRQKAVHAMMQDDGSEAENPHI